MRHPYRSGFFISHNAKKSKHKKHELYKLYKNYVKANFIVQTIAISH